MKIRTVEELQQKIDDELTWRKLELHHLFSALDTSKENIKLKNGLSRAGIALLYAHWEGFIKEVSLFYLCYLKSKKLGYKDIEPSIIAHNLKQKMKAASVSGNFLPYVEITQELVNNIMKNSRVDIYESIDTAHNLSSLILKDIFHSLGLSADWSKFETKANLIDHEMLNIRNKVVHGENYSYKNDTDIEGLKELHVQIVNLLETYKNCILNAALTYGYKREIS